MKNKPVMQMTVQQLADAGYSLNIYKHGLSTYEQANKAVAKLTGNLGGTKSERYRATRWVEIEKDSVKIIAFVGKYNA